MRTLEYSRLPLRLMVLSLCFSLCQLSAARGEVDVAPLLKTLQSVGGAGAGNKAAAGAWQELSQADAEQLPQLLAGIDDANPLAANWIRAAVDSVAQRTLQQGGKLPAKELESFALDTDHAPRARRLAYEWLARVDKSAPDRLIPGLLHDPSVEFRRDAVTRLLEEAAAKKKAGAEDGELVAIYERAFSGARDKDQVDEIAKWLQGQGREVDLAAHYGFILNWKVIGPFDNTDKAGFDLAYPPEEEIDFSATHRGKEGAVSWKEFTTPDEYGQVDLNTAIDKHMGAAAYAVAEFNSDKPQNVQLRLGSLCAVKLWLNGKLLVEREVYHAGSKEALEQYIAPGRLKRGRNVILVKICQNEQEDSWAQNWDFRLRVCDPAGTSILASDRPKKN